MRCPSVMFRFYLQLHFFQVISIRLEWGLVLFFSWYVFRVRSDSIIHSVCLTFQFIFFANSIFLPTEFFPLLPRWIVYDVSISEMEISFQFLTETLKSPFQIELNQRSATSINIKIAVRHSLVLFGFLFCLSKRDIVQ